VPNVCVSSSVQRDVRRPTKLRTGRKKRETVYYGGLSLHFHFKKTKFNQRVNYGINYFWFQFNLLNFHFIKYCVQALFKRENNPQHSPEYQISSFILSNWFVWSHGLCSRPDYSLQSLNMLSTLYKLPVVSPLLRKSNKDTFVQLNMCPEVHEIFTRNTH
jgi:hypothetical protein